MPQKIIDKLTSPTNHNASGDPLHKNDNAAVEVEAGQDIENLRLYLPKKAVITAGRDILDIFYFGQNINIGDVSVMSADGQISFHKDQFSVDSDLKGTGIVQAGSGAFVMQAGGNIDLGNTQGIKSIGDAYNPLLSRLSKDGSALLVISGYKPEITPDGAGTFFKALQDAGTAYSLLMSAGNKDDAAALLQQTETGVIKPTLGTPDAGGGINMTSTQISTSSANGNIFIITNGNLNVGKSVFFTNQTDVQSTGILTAGGGSINIFATGDINVNESRVMTFYGGDITVWSDTGNINAGRGSKTEVNASPPKLVPTGQFNDEGQPIMVLEFSPPAVGSGIRAVTYDPDGVGGPLQAPPAGDIYLFATRGIIDAGEAGISGGRVILAATQVLNVNNISFTAGSVGVPSTASAATGIGTLSGSGSVAQNSQMLSNASGIGAAGAANASQMIDDIMTQWLDVKVIDFIINDEGGA